MAFYRIYRVGPRGRLVPAEAFLARDDTHAVHHARALHDGAAAELWQDGRLVGHLSEVGEFTPSRGA